MSDFKGMSRHLGTFLTPVIVNIGCIYIGIAGKVFRVYSRRLPNVSSGCRLASYKPIDQSPWLRVFITSRMRFRVWSPETMDMPDLNGTVPLDVNRQKKLD
jgi:hypothetical protein